MQKSMVHELNPLVASNVQYTRSSFIHTVYETDFNELRKSRIQNLPNYRKQDLSGKLNFVVVFQAIEIERLSVQIETLRVKIKDYERQLCNYQNYEVQIRELTEKCHSYQLQRQNQQQHMQKMGKICQQLYNELEEMRARYADIDLSLKEKYRLEKQRSQILVSEVQKWKARYSASETSKGKQMQDMRMLLQNQRKSMIQREMREMSIKYESERSMLENQLRKLRENLQNRNYETERMRKQIQQSKIRQSELRQYEARLDEYEDKLMMMAQENMRLNQLLRMKKQQIEHLKNNQRNLDIKLSNLSKIQHEFSILAKRLQTQQTQLREWNQKYTRLEAQNNRNIILSNKAQEYERLLDNSAEEMQKMNTIIRQKIAEIDKYKSFNQRLQIELQENKLTQQQIDQYEAHMQQIVNQNQRLNDQLRNRLQETQSWKNKFSQVEAQLPLLAQTQNQCKNLKDKLNVQVATRAKLSETIALLEKDLIKAAQMEQTLIKERGINKDLQREIQRLNVSIRNLSSQNQDSVRKMQSLQVQLKENSGILEELQACKRKINMMTQELDRINGVMHQKLQQIKQLKQNYNSVSINTTRYRQIEEQFVANLEQTQKLVLKVDESRRENECLNEKLYTVEGRCKKLESEILTNNEEKERLIGIVNQKKVELQDLVSRMTKADQRISVLQTVQHQFKTLKNNYSQMQQRYKDLQSRYTRQSKRSEDISNQLQSVTAELMKAKSETNFSKQFMSQFLTLKSVSQQKDRMIVSLMQRIGMVEKCIKQLKQQGKKNYNNMCQQNERCKVLNKNFETVSVFIDKLCEMQVRIDKLSEDNLKLQSTANMLNIQMAESQYASQNSYKLIENSYKLMEENKNSYKFIEENKNNQTRTLTYHKPSSSQASSPGTKLSTIQEQCVRETSARNVQPYSQSSNMQPYAQNSNNNLNYYQSQVRQVYGNINNTYQSPLYTSNAQSSTMTYYQRPQSSNTIQYTTKAIRPGSSQQSTTTYSYSSNFNSNFNHPSITYRVLSPTSQEVQNNTFIYGSNASSFTNGSNSTSFTNGPNATSFTNGSNQSYVSQNNTGHVNHHFSNLTNIQRPTSNFVKQSAKYSVSEVKTSPDVKDKSTYQNTADPRRYVLSPVRFLN